MNILISFVKNMSSGKLYLKFNSVGKSTYETSRYWLTRFKMQSKIKVQPVAQCRHWLHLDVRHCKCCNIVDNKYILAFNPKEILVE